MYKSFEKHQKLRNLTCFILPSNLFRWIVEYNWQLFLIKLIGYHDMCFHGNNFTLATVRIFKVWSVVFRSWTLGKNESVSTFLRIPLHTQSIIEKYVSKK